jgi:hypothetical protein
MSYATRDLNNPPEYYYELSGKQKRNWRKATKKIENNEELKARYPPFNSSSNITLFHLHYLTTIDTVNKLISKAKATTKYTIDTESEKNKMEEQGALIQIQMIHSINDSTIVLVETKYLPDPGTILFKQIQAFLSIVFDMENEIISWGSCADEFKNFNHAELLDLGKVKIKTNLQFEFRNWHNGYRAHLARDRRERISLAQTLQIYDTPADLNYINYEEEVDDNTCKCGHHTHFNPSGKWSLQDAVGSALKQFLDKSETINLWQCGLDLQLDTWKNKLFNRYHYDRQREQNQRLKMIEYAKNDCISVTSIYFHMYPHGKNINNIHIHETPIIRTIINDHYETPETTSRKTIMDWENELSDVSEDDLIQILMPKFAKHTPTLLPQINEPNELTIQATAEEINELNPPEEQRYLQSTSTKLSKSEKQKIKNQKFKWKKRNRPDYQHRIIRPIYHQYDYRRIRAQLIEDNIHTSHQITIDRHKGDVSIGFKSATAQEKATQKIRANYFSKEQFTSRWGGKI